MNFFESEPDFAHPNDQGFRLHIARTPAMREIVYRLRYRAYTDAGVKLQRDDGIFPDKFDPCRNCVSHVLLQNGVVIGSIRANRCTREDESVGAQEAYAREIAAVIGEGKKYVESNRFVVDPDIANKSLTPLRNLFRGIVLHAALIDADWVITAVRTRHIAFYKRILRMEQLSEPKPYPLLSGEFARQRASVSPQSARRRFGGQRHPPTWLWIATRLPVSGHVDRAGRSKTLREGHPR